MGSTTLFQRLLFSCTDAHYRIKPSLIKPEVALNGEGLLLDLGLELDFGFLFDLRRTLLLALDLLELGGAARDALQTAQFFFNLP